MAREPRIRRPQTQEGFDRSRAAERRADPEGWRFAEAELAAVRRVITARRDIRRFRPDPVQEDVLERLLGAAHSAPSVGLMQPWRMILIRDAATRSAVRLLAQQQRIAQAERFGMRARQFLDQKIEGIVEAPLGIVVCCDHGAADVEVLGRGTIPETDIYSTACAIENLWLAARAEGVGVGWVSFYRKQDLRALLGIPSRADPIAYLCVGWPDERPVRPGLEAAGWAQRMRLEEVVMQERWQERGEGSAGSASSEESLMGPEAMAEAGGHAAFGETPMGPEATARIAVHAASRRRPVPTDRRAAIAARDRLDELVKPAGSLGALEALIERWALISGAPPPPSVKAGVLVCTADHGHVLHGTSLFDAEVSSQVAAAAARRETAVGVLAARGGHELLIADVGLRGPTPEGVLDAKVATGSADMLARPALTDEQVRTALSVGEQLCGELADRRVDCLVLGEIGVGNSTTAAALLCALTGLPPAAAVGRGSGLDAQGVRRKLAVVSEAMKRHGCPLPGKEALRRVGGIELAALAGAAGEAVRRRLPVILDGYATSVAALAAVKIDATVGEALLASHLSAEPGHRHVLSELGLEPLLDLRLRLGEASGALLALPLIAAAGALHREMGTFEESGVQRAAGLQRAARGEQAPTEDPRAGGSVAPPEAS